MCSFLSFILFVLFLEHFLIYSGVSVCLCLYCVAEVWQARDEGQNFHQHFDPELVREEKRMEVEVEVRVQVRVLLKFQNIPYSRAYTYIYTSI